MAQLRRGLKRWTGLWEALRVVELWADLDQLAGDLVEQHALGGFEATVSITPQNASTPAAGSP